MNKRKVNKVIVEFDNNERYSYHNLNATFSESRNGRKGGDLEWTEYHITWVEYDKPEVKPRKSPEELEAEAIARSKEKMKNPLYAGTQDGRDFYHSPPPTFESWENFIAELSKDKPNGQLGSQ